VIKKGRIGENYNIGGHNEWANIDIVKVVCKLMNEAFNTSDNKLYLKTKFPLALSAVQGNAESLITFV
jgi:dTDP-glucose 4,6-dehydratase